MACSSEKALCPHTKADVTLPWKGGVVVVWLAALRVLDLFYLEGRDGDNFCMPLRSLVALMTSVAGTGPV